VTPAPARGPVKTSVPDTPGCHGRSRALVPHHLLQRGSKCSYRVLQFVPFGGGGEWSYGAIHAPMPVGPLVTVHSSRWFPAGGLPSPSVTVQLLGCVPPGQQAATPLGGPVTVTVTVPAAWAGAPTNRLRPVPALSTSRPTIGA
jgi:hypothetical protein